MADRQQIRCPCLAFPLQSSCPGKVCKRSDALNAPCIAWAVTNQTSTVTQVPLTYKDTISVEQTRRTWLMCWRGPLPRLQTRNQCGDPCMEMVDAPSPLGIAGQSCQSRHRCHGESSINQCFILLMTIIQHKLFARVGKQLLVQSHPLSQYHRIAATSR